MPILCNIIDNIIAMVNWWVPILFVFYAQPPRCITGHLTNPMHMSVSLPQARDDQWRFQHHVHMVTLTHMLIAWSLTLQQRVLLCSAHSSIHGNWVFETILYNAIFWLYYLQFEYTRSWLQLTRLCSRSPRLPSIFSSWAPRRAICAFRSYTACASLDGCGGLFIRPRFKGAFRVGFHRWAWSAAHWAVLNLCSGIY